MKFIKIKLVLFTLITILLFPNFAFADAFQDGINAYNQQNYNLAEIYFKQALDYNQNNPNIRYYLAITLVKNKKLLEARREYSTIILTAPDTEAAFRASQGLASVNIIIKYLKPDKVVLDMKDNATSIVIRNVKINNSITANFILDSGATYTSISPALARRLGIYPQNAPKVSIMTANGLVNTYKVHLDSMEINGLVAKDVEVIILDLGTNRDVSGLLGLNFINKFRVTLDKKRLILENP
jgi:clan AA aspartic protease (TIGR02281 family)